VSQRSRFHRDLRGATLDPSKFTQPCTRVVLTTPLFVDGPVDSSTDCVNRLIDSGSQFMHILFVAPFTEHYAREQVPEQYWGSPKFKEINRKLTTMWACIFAAMVPFHVIAGAIDTKAGNIIFNWAIPLGLVVWGIKRSTAPDEADASTVQTIA
jgi:hypothetical protein